MNSNIYFHNVRSKAESRGQVPETLGVHRCCAKSVLAGNYSIARCMVINLAYQLLFGLDFKPLEAFLPEAVGVAGEKHDATRSSDTKCLREELLLIDPESGDSVLNADRQIKGVIPKTQVRRIHRCQVERFAYPKSLFLPPDLITSDTKEMESRLEALAAYSTDIFIVGGGQKIPLCRRGSGFDAAGLDYLIGKRTQYYARRQRDRTLMRGDRVAVLGRGIAVVEHVDSEWIFAAVWNKCELRIARKEIVWDEGNMRWETDTNAPFECLAGKRVPPHYGFSPVRRRREVLADSPTVGANVRDRFAT